LSHHTCTVENINYKKIKENSYWRVENVIGSLKWVKEGDEIERRVFSVDNAMVVEVVDRGRSG